MAILTVYTKLLDKSLSGARIIDMGSTRTCRLYVIPREQLTLVSKEKLLHQYCFYVLLGQTLDSTPKAYIGQSNDFLHRVKDHQSKKDFWDTALVFVSKANEVYASEVLFLEYLGIKKAMEAGTYSLDENKQIPQKPSIAPDKENDMELFFDEIMFLTKFYGRDIFEPSEDSSKAETHEQPHTFYMDAPKSGVKAALDYYPSDNRYVIKAGSRIRAKATKSIPAAIRKRREELFAIPSIMHPEGDFYVLKMDVELLVTSPSAAASFCTGTAMQGTTAWIDAEKKSFANVFK
jgi:hypothetical protein